MSYKPWDLPLASFGEVRTSELTPVIQATAIYGLSGKMRTSVSGAGAAASYNSQNEFTVASGTSSTGTATIFSKSSIPFRPGQGTVCMFSARFSTPVASTVQFAGMTNATDGVVIGYSGTTFGLFYRRHGSQEIQRIEVTGAAGAATNATITINGTAYTVPLTVTTVAGNAAEIAASLTTQIPSWIFNQVGAYVYARSLVSAVFAGAFSFTHATATATFTQVAAGVAVTETFTAATALSEGSAAWITGT